MGGFEIAVLLGIAALAAGGFASFRRVERLIAELAHARDSALRAEFRQVEALAALYHLLRPRKYLPPTRDWAGSPDFLLVVAEHTLRARPRTIVECGSGVSTVVLGRCVELNGAGHVYSLDHDAAYAARTRELLAEQSLTPYATVVDAPLVHVELPDWTGSWYDTSRLDVDGKFDALVVDGPPHFASDLARYPAGPLLFERLAEGGAIIMDDADRGPEREIIERWSKLFPQLRPMALGACEKGCRGYRWVGLDERPR